MHSVGIELGVPRLLGEEAASAPDRGRAAPLTTAGNRTRRGRGRVGTAARALTERRWKGQRCDTDLQSTAGQELTYRTRLTLDSLMIYPGGISLPFPSHGLKDSVAG